MSGNLFQSSLLFVDKVRSQPCSGAPERVIDRVGSCFIDKHCNRLKRLAREKHSSLLHTFLNYNVIMLYNFFVRDLRIFVIS